MLVALAIVVGSVVGLSRLVQRWQSGRGVVGQMGHIEVASRRALGKNAALLVVRVANRTFLVSQTSQQLSLLSELDDEVWHTPSPSHLVGPSRRRTSPGPRMARANGEVSPSAWDAFIEHLREVTVRR